MPFLMDEIDAGGTRRKLEDITAGGMRAFDEVQQRSAQIDEEFKQARAKYDAEAAAMDKLVADAKAARQPKSESEEEQATTGPWTRRDTKPTVHAFGGDEFAEDPRTEPTGIRVPPLEAPSAPPPPAPPVPAGVEPVREMAFGYDDPDETGAVAVPPAATREPAPCAGPVADDDDLSGHSWMR
jgi:hypothetical protein